MLARERHRKKESYEEEERERRREGGKKKESERRRSNSEFCKTKFQFIVFKSEIIRSIVAFVLLVRVHLGFISFLRSFIFFLNFSLNSKLKICSVLFFLTAKCLIVS